MGIYTNINKVIQSARLILTALAVLFFMWMVVDYWRGRSALVPKTTDKFTQMIEQRSDNINTYIFSQIQQLEELAQQNEVQKLFTQLIEPKRYVVWSNR